MTNAILAFARAVLWGSLAGGGPFLLLTVPVAIESPQWGRPEAIWIAAMPIAIAAAVVALAAAFFGVPLTAWLARQDDESRLAYVIAGLGVGALLPIALVAMLFGDAEAGAFLAIPGAFAGAVTGASWGRWREQVAGKAADR
jgi:hypothetical protein